MKNTVTILAQTALKDCLVYNNRFRSGVINAAQIGADDFATWKYLVGDVHKKSYKVYEALENHEPTAALKSEVFEAIKRIMSAMGDLTLLDKDGNPHRAPIVIDDEFNNAIAELCSKYAGKLGNDDAPELQLCQSKIRNAEKLLKEYSKHNGVSPEAIAKLEEELDQLEEEKSALLKTADMSKKKPVISSEASFRSAFERHIARTIVGQKAQSWEEYVAAKEAKRQARRQATKEKRADKAKAEKSAK